MLKSLIDLRNLKESNSSIKALAYQLYENNGVVKREMVTEYLKKLGQDERKILRDLGVKFGRYHIFLFKLLKPEAVSLRTLLWKNFNQKYFELTPPTFGLNFLDDKNKRNKTPTISTTSLMTSNFSIPIVMACLWRQMEKHLGSWQTEMYLWMIKAP